MNKHAIPNALRSLPGVIQNGGSKPRFYEFDDGVARLVKWHPSIHGPRVCFNELVASRLAQLIDVPLLRGCVVYVSDVVIPADQKEFAKEGFHFAVYKMKGSNYLPDTHQPIICNADEFPLAATYLAWLQVADQEGHNQYKQEIEDPNDPKNTSYRYRLADMGFTFGVGNTANWTAATLGKSVGYTLPNHLAKHLTADQLAKVINEIEKIPESDVRACFDDIPIEWGLAPADVLAATEWILAARANLKPLITKGNPQIVFADKIPVTAQAPGQITTGA
jgi:hypothetical protein